MCILVHWQCDPALLIFPQLRLATVGLVAMKGTYTGAADLGQALPAHVADDTRQPLAAPVADPFWGPRPSNHVADPFWGPRPSSQGLGVYVRAAGVVPGSASMHSSCAPGFASASSIEVPPVLGQPHKAPPPKRQALLAKTTPPWRKGRDTGEQDKVPTEVRRAHRLLRPTCCAKAKQGRLMTHMPVHRLAVRSRPSAPPCPRCSAPMQWRPAIRDLQRLGYDYGWRCDAGYILDPQVGCDFSTGFNQSDSRWHCMPCVFDVCDECTMGLTMVAQYFAELQIDRQDTPPAGSLQETPGSLIGRLLAPP